MNSIRSSLILFGLVISLSSGCNLTRMISFREQMQDISKYTAWEDSTKGWVFVFKVPLLTIADLNDYGIFPVFIDERNAVLGYSRVAAGALSGEYDILLRFAGGRLAELILPKTISEGLGRDNITCFFAMIGGREVAASSLVPVTSNQLLSTGFFVGQPESIGREVVVCLRPTDARNRPILIRLTDLHGTGHFDGFEVNFKR
jgi:hypothetical protein